MGVTGPKPRNAQDHASGVAPAPELVEVDQDGEQEGGRLPGPGLRAPHDVALLEHAGDGAPEGVHTYGRTTGHCSALEMKTDAEATQALFKMPFETHP